MRPWLAALLDLSRFAWSHTRAEVHVNTGTYNSALLSRRLVHEAEEAAEQEKVGETQTEIGLSKM